MFEFIDLIIGPLLELNPVRYVGDAAYRARKTHALGRMAKRIFVYQLVVALLLVSATVATAIVTLG